MHDHHDAPGHGHNHVPRPAAQWQTPHDPQGHAHKETSAEPDLDLVEAAFVEAFDRAPDAASFLRVARVPFVTERDGALLHLLRVQIESITDTAAVSPLLGGGYRVSPLPKKLIGTRRSLRFIYQGPGGPSALSLADIRDLPDRTPPV